MLLHMSSTYADIIGHFTFLLCLYRYCDIWQVYFEQNNLHKWLKVITEEMLMTFIALKGPIDQNVEAVLKIVIGKRREGGPCNF